MIGILTFQKTTNYGSLLQTFALYRAISDLEIPCEVIDYECWQVEKNEMPLRLKNCTSIKKIFRYILLNRFRKDKLKKFNDFSALNIKLSALRYHKSDIKTANLKYCGFIVGSDIVWGPDITGDDLTFFLDFAEKDKIKISYAASLGNGIEQYSQEIGTCLNQFKAISMREVSGKEKIEAMAHRAVKIVLDPTLLFGSKFWNNYTEKRQVQEKYILVYFALEPQKVFKKVRELAHKTGHKIVYIQDTLRQNRDFMNVRSASIGEFLSYIRYAEYIVTGSYHGVAFSVNFNKQFITNNVDYTDRILCLLNLLGVGDRDMKRIDPLKEQIDYGIVNSKLKECRSDSQNWLKDALKDYDKANMRS